MVTVLHDLGGQKPLNAEFRLPGSPTESSFNNKILEFLSWIVGWGCCDAVSHTETKRQQKSVVHKNLKCTFDLSLPRSVQIRKVRVRTLRLGKSLSLRKPRPLLLRLLRTPGHATEKNEKGPEVEVKNEETMGSAP